TAMAKSIKRQFAINAGSGFLAQLTTAGVGFIILPYAIWRLGDEAYGLFQLAASALVFFTFLHMGMGPTLVRFCAKAIANKDHEDIHKISSSAQLILSVLGFIGLVGVVIMIPFFLRIYNVPEELKSETIGLLLCMAASLFLNMLFIVPNGLLLGCNRYDVANGIEIVANLLRLGLIIACFELIGPSIWLMGLCMFSTQLFRFALLFTFAYKYLGKVVFFSVKAVNRESLKSLFSFGALNLVKSIANYFVIQGPILIIGAVPGLGPKAVALFSPAILIATSLQIFLEQMSKPLVPLASKAQADGNTRRLGQMAVQVAGFSVSVGLLIVLPLTIYGSEIIGLWLGQEKNYLWLLISIMAVGIVLSRSAAVLSYIALGGGSILPEVYSQVVLGFITLAGVAIGAMVFQWDLLLIGTFMTIVRCLRCVVYLPWAYRKAFSFAMSEYVTKVYIKPVLIFFIILVAGRLLRVSEFEGNYFWLICHAIILFAAYGAAVFLFVLPESIKSKVLKLIRR
ncbi:MAG: oligosaccharide flippase family protein, partial [Sedimentisphaerales bacterium]|nr:oligosaccharide flippase family protein [Sedimentisphaerales bacterium]